MAIKVPTYQSRGATFQDVYVRVEQYRGGKYYGPRVEGLAKIFVSEAVAKPQTVNGVAPAAQFLEEIAVSASWVSGVVPETALYAALKVLPAMAGATDV